MKFISNNPTFFFLLAGIAAGGSCTCGSVSNTRRRSFFSVVRRAKEPVLDWATVGFNGLALALVYFGVIYTALAY